MVMNKARTLTNLPVNFYSDESINNLIGPTELRSERHLINYRIHLISHCFAKSKSSRCLDLSLLQTPRPLQDPSVMKNWSVPD